MTQRCASSLKPTWKWSPMMKMCPERSLPMTNHGFTVIISMQNNGLHSGSSIRAAVGKITSKSKQYQVNIDCFLRFWKFCAAWTRVFQRYRVRNSTKMRITNTCDHLWTVCTTLYLCFVHTLVLKSLLHFFDGSCRTFFKFKAKLDANSLSVSL